MKIYFERSGGFAGLRLAVNLDLETMSGDDAESLQKLIDDADLFNIPQPEVRFGVPDSFQYTITVERRDEKRTLQLGDRDLTPGLQPLINDLSLRARTHRNKN